MELDLTAVVCSTSGQNLGRLLDSVGRIGEDLRMKYYTNWNWANLYTSVSTSPTPRWGTCYIRKKQIPRVIGKSMTYNFSFSEETLIFGFGLT